MKINFKIFPLIGIMVLPMNFAGCDKDDDTIDPRGNTTGTFTDTRDSKVYK